MCIRDSNTTDELTNETVDAKGSRIDNVDVLSQLASFMEMMSNKFDRQNTNLNEFRTEVNDKLDKQDEKIKSENSNLKSEIKSEINTINIKLTDLFCIELYC